MKKNLRIVSAAAAALLAVAPVAAAVVPAASTVQAASEGTPVAAHDKKADGLKYTASVHDTNPWIFSKSSNNTWAVASKEGLKKTQHIDIIRGKEVINGETLRSLGVNWAVKGQDYSVYEITSGQFAGNYILSLNVTDLRAYQVTNGQDLPAGAYFSYEGHDYATGDTIYLNPFDSDVKSINALEQTVINRIQLLGAGNLSSTEAWHKFVFDEGNSTIKRDIKSQLQEQGISVDANDNFNAGSKQFSIKFLANGGKSVTVVFQNTEAVNLDNPVFQTRSDARGYRDGSLISRVEKTDWSEPFNAPSWIETINVTKRDSGSFNPTDYIQASDHATTVTGGKLGTTGRITFTTKSNNVDWTKPGLYSVEVTATNKAGKTTDLTIPVVVNDVNGKVMTAINDAQIYTENNGTMTQANLVNNQYNKGAQVYVFGNPVTKKLNGQDVQFYRVFDSTSNFYVRASDLQNGVVSTPVQETTKTVKIMHIATIYDKNGKATHESALRAYHLVSVVSEPVSLKDEKGKDAGKFYKLAGTETDQYIKVGNVDGTSRSLKHNSYVYKSTGKRRGKTVLKKGSSVTTYGKSFMIAGHQMYRIGENQYVKKANF